VLSDLKTDIGQSMKLYFVLWKQIVRSAQHGF